MEGSSVAAPNVALKAKICLLFDFNLLLNRKSRNIYNDTERIWLALHGSRHRWLSYSNWFLLSHHNLLPSPLGCYALSQVRAGTLSQVRAQDINAYTEPPPLPPLMHHPS